MDAGSIDLGPRKLRALGEPRFGGRRVCLPLQLVSALDINGPGRAWEVLMLVMCSSSCNNKVGEGSVGGQRQVEVARRRV